MAVPAEVARCDRRDKPLGAGHLHPGLLGILVAQEVIKDRRQTIRLLVCPRVLTCCFVRETLKAESVGKFVQQDRDQIELRAWVVVQPQIPTESREAILLPQFGIEKGSDVRELRYEV